MLGSCNKRFDIPLALFLGLALLFAGCGEGKDEKAPTPETSSAASTKEHVINQKNKQFSSDDLTIKVGDTVNFVNDDEFFHNVYSLSETKVFDLGSYPKGEGRKVKFDQPGEVMVECAIHDNMKMKIKVEQ